MRNIYLFLYLIILLSLPARLYSQTYQLTGTPINTAGWTMAGSAVLGTGNDFIQLTPDVNEIAGSIRLNDPINLKYCDRWKVEYDFMMDSNDTNNGDGIAFWYLQNPPLTSVLGAGIGVSQNAVGLIVALDTYFNAIERPSVSLVHVAYGEVANTTENNTVEAYNVPGSSFHSPNLDLTQPFQGPTYKHVEVTAEVDPAAPTSWIIKMTIDGTQIFNQSFAPSGAAAGITAGYFGFSSSTGGSRSRHSIKNVKIYVDKVAINQNTITDDYCPNPTTGQAIADLTSYENQFIANPANYTFTYSVTGTPITNPTNYQFGADTTVSMLIKDNSGVLCDNPDGQIQLNISEFTASPATLTECDNNNVGTATFNLSLANVNEPPGSLKQYYKTLADLNAGTNEILNPTAYVSAATTIYVKVTTPLGCTGSTEITLAYFPAIVSNDATIESCFIDSDPTTASFDLTQANVTSAPAITKQYYKTQADALAGTNEILNPTAYISTSSTVYVKITNVATCFVIVKINLKLLPPIYSSLLKDETICIDDTTNLDAGAGFDSYLWNTGATTQSIQNVSPGLYWVQLKTGKCTTMQIVKVNAAPQPVISSIDITNNTIKVNVIGGKGPYQYSLDGINWQDSNIFTGLARGEVVVYVKDSYDCTPIHVQITVPNLINAITPNGDNLNDVIDYTALAYKKNLVFTIYDRYGNKLYEANKLRNYKWNGTAGGKKVVTATYWYTITWNENNKESTLTTYNGWVLLKIIKRI
ncbi:gliding motility-associated-like protein [Chryseobacterium ginsenosidimutans]|uniref:T9SS type B sorting domain-containing protein n=1 Tax=Chryseobacterium ginsenosidimutans TaxID=687846 RepID=UPI00216A074D|nr:T9SS type B sorting domain-containing protein [Chryseobacterium ginsenosidimutans]MCS3867804.1 gliding motility-associated-like protein [Chryseobacterium ginsenosidimutans]